MASLTRDQVKAVVTKSLQSVAGLPADIESATFDQFTDMAKRTFLSDLKTNLNAVPYQTDSGGTSDKAYYDVDLTADSLSQWATVKVCIDWITANQKVVYKN